jgi:hypothetical protein
LKKTAKLFNPVKILEFSSNRKLFTQHGLHLNKFGKGLLAKHIASLIYKLSFKKNEDSISLKCKMELNENATMHIANQEILILNDQCT